MTEAHPPKPRLVLNVGITGHRAHLLPDELTGELAERLREIFGALRQAADELQGRNVLTFAAEPAQLRLHTALATGADQIAATSAHKEEYHVRALLPFSPDEYARDFSTRSENQDYYLQLSAADEFFALPGKREAEEHAYVMVGKAIIAAADILIAVWDGSGGNGIGGTAHVVEMAIRAGVPIVQIPINRAEGKLGACRLISGGDFAEPITEPMDSPAAYSELVRKTLSPPVGDDLAALSLFYAEKEQQVNLRIEYPLMLALLGIRKLSSMPWRQSSIEEGRKDKLGASNDTDNSHIAAYAWANFLAIRYAQMFRSGHIMNYFLAAMAVLVALGGLLAPAIKPYLVLSELGVIGLLFLNTKVGIKGEWHRRWLQYRHLAESLRPLAYLKRTGLAGTPFRNDYPSVGQFHTAHTDWTRWYAAAMWREMASPGGVVDDRMIEQLVREVQVEQIEPQIAYHKVNAERMEHLDHRLHSIGNLLMGIVIAACVLYLVGYVLAHDFITSMTYFFVFTTAGLPAVGAAVFGMRGHGEHLLAASRSTSTIKSLTGNKNRLDEVSGLESVTGELEKTAEIMLDDLSEWNVAYRERTLQVPG